MSKKNVIIAIIAISVIGGGMFYAGMEYGNKKNSSQKMFREGNNNNKDGFSNGNKQGQGNFQRMGGERNGANGNFISGEIISKDEKSITIKNRNGGSAIVYFSDSTHIGKSESGSLSDLNVGGEVMINGKSNPDGSLSAENIQIRPAQQ
jgi:hypothetical protein